MDTVLHAKLASIEVLLNTENRWLASGKNELPSPLEHLHEEHQFQHGKLYIQSVCARAAMVSGRSEAMLAS